MNRPTEQQILDFLEGKLGSDETTWLLDLLEESPELREEVRLAALGMEAATAWADDERGAAERPTPRRVPMWAIPLTAAATALLAVPAAQALSPDRPAGSFEVGAPVSPDPAFVVVLQGRWPDASEVDQAETERRAREYWGWTTDLAARGHLVAAGDLRWEPGLRLTSAGQVLETAPAAMTDPDFLVGMIAVRASTYEEARALAQECPHLRYGGSVAVRRVGSGFVTVPGQDDWSE